MSTDYDYRCKTCSVNFGFSDLNHQQDALREIYRACWASLVDLGKSLKQNKTKDLGYALERVLGMDAFKVWQLAEWAAKHEGHDIAVFDEYGREWDQCHDYTHCPTCKTTHPCVLKSGHGGEHQSEAK